MDYALREPIPWRAKETLHSATVHLGGTLEEIAAGESEVWQGRLPEKPYVLLAQPSLFDSSRAPAGRHTAWAYCHEPAGSTVDMTARIEAQIERYAPGFCDLVLARRTFNTQEMESYNPNYIESNGKIISELPAGRQNLDIGAQMRPYRSRRQRWGCRQSQLAGFALAGQ